MRRRLNISYILLLVCASISFVGWQQAGGKGDKSSRVLLPYVYLGNSNYKGGPIKKDEFSRLLKQGLISHDSLGNKYKVSGFNFNYAERQLYEDSIGNMSVLTDYLFEYCPGDTITTNIASSIYNRIKAGDTVFIDRITVKKYLGKNKSQLDTNIIGAQSMKCVIIK